MSVILSDFIADNIDLFITLNQETTPRIITKLQDLFTDWSTLFKKLIQTPEMQLRLIALMEDICIEFEKLYNFFNIILQILKGDIDVISDEVVIEWSTVESSKYPTCDGEKVIDAAYHGRFVAKCKKFVDSLK
jgi:hypothetical protein